MSLSSLQHSTDQREWEGLVAREARHQGVIEASFDRAEAYERLGDFGHALEWLDRAAALGGELPPTYQAKRDRWARAGAHRMRPRVDQAVCLAWPLETRPV